MRPAALVESVDLVVRRVEVADDDAVILAADEPASDNPGPARGVVEETHCRRTHRPDKPVAPVLTPARLINMDHRAGAGFFS